MLEQTNGPSKLSFPRKTTKPDVDGLELIPIPAICLLSKGSARRFRGEHSAFC